MIPLDSLFRCFSGVVPSTVATADASGLPNVSYLSQVFYVDERHVALSRQFFNKTAKNVRENANAMVHLMDPLTLESYRLRLRFDHEERSGPLFESMAARIDAIASMTGMSGVFRLVAADVFEVVSVEPIEDFLVPPEETPRTSNPIDGRPSRRTELRGLQIVSEQINRACDLESLLEATLETMDSFFEFRHSMVLLVDETGSRMVTLASRGYGEGGVGAEVLIGEGLIGAVARDRKVLRISSIDAELRYGRAIRGQVAELAGASSLAHEIPLPGLCDARSLLVLPLLVGQRLVGVLSVESRDALAFQEWHEAYLEIIANQIALGIDRILERAGREEPDDEPARMRTSPVPAQGPEEILHTFCFYRNDDCVFVDGEYLIRNVPGKILWKILTQWTKEGRREFANRELRLDPTLGLPPIKDNLESRLILLRRRLEEKCPDVRIVPTRRGRFALELRGPVALVERDSA